jgi:hypothetical protein
LNAFFGIDPIPIVRAMVFDLRPESANATNSCTKAQGICLYKSALNIL